MKKLGDKYKIASVFKSSEKNVIRHYIGKLDKVCKYCQALHFKDEATRKGFKSCCHFGKVEMDELDCPPEFVELLRGKHKLSKKYFEHIRGYNSAMSFASFEANIVSNHRSVNGRSVPGFGVPYFKISGTKFNLKILSVIYLL